MKNLSLKELQPLIIEWANNKDLLKFDNAPKQRLKLFEECGELSSAILKNNTSLQKDAIGDIFVVLVILAQQIGKKLNFEDFIDLKVCEDESEAIFQIFYNSFYGRDMSMNTDFLYEICLFLELDLTECANIAWNEIKNRTGETINGTFIKNNP